MPEVACNNEFCRWNKDMHCTSAIIFVGSDGIETYVFCPEDVDPADPKAIAEWRSSCEPDFEPYRGDKRY